MVGQEEFQWFAGKGTSPNLSILSVECIKYPTAIFNASQVLVKDRNLGGEQKVMYINSCTSINLCVGEKVLDARCLTPQALC